MAMRWAMLLAEATERFLGETFARLEAAGHTDLSVSHAFAIQLIDQGVSTITALAAVMRMSPQAVSAIVDRLESRGFVERNRIPEDARARPLRLTVRGDELAAVIAHALEAAEASWAALVGPSRLADAASVVEAYVSQPETPAAERRFTRRVRIR